MIRFSAVLVTAAIGLLAGGVATSKLLLVYIAIAVSAVALVALAIGVVLKREEIFGAGQGRKGQGAGPAQANAGPALSAHAGEGDDRGHADGQAAPPPQGTAPPPQGAVAGPGAAFAGYGQAEPSQQEETRPGGAREPRAGHDPWPAPVPATLFPGAWQAPSRSDAPAASWGAPAPAEFPAHAGPVPHGGTEAHGGTGPGPWTASAPSVFAPRTAEPQRTGDLPPGEGRSAWFSPSDRHASAGEPAHQAASSWSWLNGDDQATADEGQDEEQADEGRPGGSAAADGRADQADKDDGRPVRYSWLADDPGEGAERAAGPGAPLPAGGVPASLGAPDPAPAGTGTAGPAGQPGDGPGPGPSVQADGDAPVDDGGPDSRELDDGEPGAAGGKDAGEPEDSAAAAADEAGMVAVVRGVPRFHQPDCVLIRFMPDGDIQKLPAAEAKDAGCTACTVCEPAG